jgi:NADH dehydrogenase FAD-containing subunit
MKRLLLLGAALARAAGARFLHDEIVGMDPQRRQARLQRGAALEYDVASLNIGSTLEPPAVRGVDVLSLRPLDRLQAAWDELLRALSASHGSTPLRVTAVGGGAAGVEALLAVLARLRAVRPHGAVQGTLITRSTALVSGHVHLDAIAIHIDRARWTRQFLRQWPEGSDAHASYWHRISAGPDYAPSDALRTQED